MREPTLQFYEQYARFTQRMAKTEALVKSIDPGDYKGISRALDPHGSEVVDHTPHLTAHPGVHQPVVDTYKRLLDPTTPVSKRTPKRLEGITKKIVYAVPDENTPAKQHLFMVKPYHERVTRAAKQWMGHPIQGWAEMTNQALWHAAGLGHIHQGVHTALHNMGKGHEAEPALVIAMHPKAKLLTGFHPKNDPRASEARSHWDPSMMDDMAKIGVMDFLTHNMDRHPHNLMYVPSDYVDDTGTPPSSRLLAIDHGRNFQYKSSVKSMPKYAVDKNGVKRPLEPWEKPDPLSDNLGHYIFSRAGRFLAAVGHSIGHDPGGMRQIVDHIANWWPNVANEVTSEFKHHLESIKDPSVKEHLLKNFVERVKLLDRIAGEPDMFKSMGTVATEVPIHPHEAPILDRGVAKPVAKAPIRRRP